MAVETGRELAPIDGEFDVVRPLVNASEAMARWNEYQQLVQKVVNETDIQSFMEDGQKRSFIKKSGWQKLATYYGISTSMVDERLFHKHNAETCLRAKMPDKYGDVTDCGCAVVGARYVVRATAPNGRSVEAIGVATFNEKRARYTRVEHDLSGKAYTRALNRAISSMIGAGEVSAEEKEEERLPSGTALKPIQVEKYEDLWKMALPERRERVRAFLEGEGYGPGEFRKRGSEHFDFVVAVLEGRDEMP
jgi:hypothetical protein